MTVYILATLDTKGVEAGFVRATLISASGEIEVHIVDTGCMGEPQISADIDRESVFRAAGTSLATMQERGDRGQAVAQAAAGAANLMRQWHSEGRVDGVLGLGGSAGTTISTEAMRALPLGVPKLMVSTLASGQVRPYVGDKDILMLNSVVDILGINRISRMVLENAARAMAGMVGFASELSESTQDKRLIAATMFGVTTPCVERAREVLEEAGFEVLVFHATGNGGQAMESLISDGLIAGVLDITTTELADELVGGILSAGPNRLTAAGRCGVPQVVSVGATDMVNFGDNTPNKFDGRLFYEHNPTVTLMRTTLEECRQLGEEIAQKVSASKGPAVIMLPLNGVSAIDREGQPFDDPAAREALFDAIRQNDDGFDLVELPCHINDVEFAEEAARRLIALIEKT